MTITTEFWNFIQKYLPNYSERQDVLRQSKLQLFIDGLERTVDGLEMDKGEAEDELHHILYNLYIEAIDAYTKGGGEKCDECKTYRHYDYCPVCGKKQI